ncbi:MAG: TIGR03761 family integrating conjugative element protein [Woeseiaceae bacterium]|nr:TIGR03761 family integrating conjugative element protein [Woeseiaceae bacterium]
MIESSKSASVAQPLISGARAASAAAPGKLRGDAWLTVQTRHAKRLITGRDRTDDKPAIIGLVGFADRVRVIWNAAKADDPYASWWLIKIEHALARARTRIQAERAALAATLQHESAFDVEVAVSEKPYRFALRFASPYAYRGALLVASFDATACRVLTLQHVGVLERAQAERSLHLCASAVRRVFATPQGYRALGIDRAAVRAGSEAARAAAVRMGVVPLDILSGECQASLGTAAAARAGAARRAPYRE